MQKNSIEALDVWYVGPIFVGSHWLTFPRNAPQLNTNLNFVSGMRLKGVTVSRTQMRKASVHSINPTGKILPGDTISG